MRHDRELSSMGRVTAWPCATIPESTPTHTYTLSCPPSKAVSLPMCDMRQMFQPSYKATSVEVPERSV